MDRTRTSESTVREKQLAHACDLTVIADSAAYLHEPGLIERLAVERLGLDVSAEALRFDLLAIPELANQVGDQPTIELLVNDLLTAIGLHGAERLLVLTADQDCQPLVERLSNHPAINGKLRQIAGHAVKPPAGCRTADSLLIGCMDWRLHAIGDFAAKSKSGAGLNDKPIMVATIPGVAKELVAETVRFQTLVSQLRYLQENRGLRRLYLVSHEDCGKYGGHQAFDSLEAEIAKLTADLKIASSRLREAFPELEIAIGLAGLDDNRTGAIDWL